MLRRPSVRLQIGNGEEGNTLVEQNDRIHEHTLFSVMGQKLNSYPD